MKLLSTALGMIFLSQLSLAATSNDFSGKYSVITNDCSPQVFGIGNDRIIVKGDETGIQIGEVFTLGGSPHGVTTFRPSATYQAGGRMDHNLGSGYSLFYGGYSLNQHVFTNLHMAARFDDEHPVYRGETRLELNGSELVIHLLYGSDKVCVFRKNR